ncbi:hypothetical protein EUX98_g1916 [Antrodiella citrinella]|uniref:F-box domain-containing protein n=1 Tax=Antrodiella citrinella TaxID=2447956 RepID=A0A4S4N3D2_9APHY|nr:hypothetical protein EUX98_g1916 [Antrodiella citrinella]
MTPILAEMHWIFETCSTLPVPLSTVSRLDIETMTFSAEFIGVLRRNFCNVKEMRLGQCSFVTTSCFFELLTLPRLTNVVLADAYIKPSTVRMMLPYGNSSVPLAHEPVVPEINQDASRRANIRSLRFTSRVAYDVFAPQMLRWLTKEGTCRDLTVLDIPTLQENDITVLEETLRAVGSQLRELAVGFAMEVVMKWDGQRALLDLKHCTSLNVFTIRCLKFRISPIDVAEHVPSAYVTAVFSTLASPFLHTLNLRFRSAHIRIREDEHVIDWVTLCNTVLNLPTLRTNVRAPAQVMRLTNSKAHPLFRLNLEFYTRTSLMQDAYPAIRRGVAALTSDGRVGVQCMFQDPFRCTGPIWLTV